MSDLAELTRRLGALEAVEEIKTLKSKYFRFVDEKKHDEWAALFAPGAKLDIDGNTWAPQDMAVAMRDLIGAAPSVHHGHNPEIEILSEDTASGTWGMDDILPFPAGPDAPEGHHGYGIYRETYRRVDGKWLFDTVNLTRLRMDQLENWDPDA